MWQTILKVWQHKDLRNKIAYVLGLLIIFRLAAHIPIPGVDINNLRNFFSSNAYLGFLNVFSGGALENFSLVMLGVGPYITASIIFQLLGMIVPKLEEMQKETDGHRKIQQWTRYLAVPMALIQGYATLMILQRTGGLLLNDITIWQKAMIVCLITGGSIFAMWLGELITEKNIGNGISIIIFAGIVARLPQATQQLLVSYDSSQLPLVVFYLAVALVMIFGVVYITEGQRNIPIATARQMRGQSLAGRETHLPMRVNQAGVIPIIFAVSLVLIPPIIGQYMAGTGIGWLVTFGNGIVYAFNNKLIYGLLYFFFVFVFTYFYTAVVFKPEQIAENLQKRGSFIPGIRPGKATIEYLQYVSNRLLLAGAVFLGLVAVLPVIIQALISGSTNSFIVGGTSLLIVVSVAIETVKQIEAQLQVREYEAF
ncbi:MAG: preprotein translocase subunit SecY [Patescibacteria group bacterium]|jgi:preprotein translocase subunit SecY